MDTQNETELKKVFQHPDRRYAIYPIIHGGVAANPSRAEDIERKGFAGIVGNVPYGEGYPDDEAEWQRTANGFREFLKRGMHVYVVKKVQRKLTPQIDQHVEMKLDEWFGYQVNQA